MRLKDSIEPAQPETAGPVDLQFDGLRIMRAGPEPMYIPEHAHVEAQIQTRYRRVSGGAGLEPVSTFLYSPHEPHIGQIEENCEVVVLLLSPKTIMAAADELFVRDRVEIKSFKSQRAPFVEQIHRAVRDEMLSPLAAGSFYLESLGHVMTGYILRHHAVTSGRRTIRGTFSAAQLERINRYIDDHMAKNFSIHDLASHMKLGPQRFAARFRMTTHLSPWQYVQQRRLARAKALLSNGRMTLTEIALTLGFSSQSHFATAFRKGIGISPKRFRDNL